MNLGFTTQRVALISLVLAHGDSAEAYSNFLCIFFWAPWIFPCMKFSSCATIHIISGLRNDICTSSPPRSSIASETLAQRSFFHRSISDGFVFAVSVGVCFLFSIYGCHICFYCGFHLVHCSSCLARHLISGLPSSQRNLATPQAPPWPDTPPHRRTTSLFTWLKYYTWNTEDTTKEGGRKSRTMRS